jgi:hypothetical protein
MNRTTTPHQRRRAREHRERHEASDRRDFARSEDALRVALGMLPMPSAKLPEVKRDSTSE